MAFLDNTGLDRAAINIRIGTGDRQPSILLEVMIGLEFLNIMVPRTTINLF